MPQDRDDQERISRILVMGILNVTPDSFFDGGRSFDTETAISHGLSMIEDGADILDIGGESSRPGADPVSLTQEKLRVLPVIEALRTHTDAAISVDTTKASVAESALQRGATIINDISAMRFDTDMPHVVARYGAKIVLMHMRGTPQTMQQSPEYNDVVHEVRDFLLERADAAESAGIPRENIILDPGIGFGKTLEHNLLLLRHLPILCASGYTVLIGVSRKSFLGRLLDLPVEERLEGTIAANTIAILHGADIIRVHDVKEGRRAADVAVRLRP